MPWWERQHVHDTLLCMRVLRNRTVLPRDTHISHVVIALRGRASRNSRLGHYATKFADARLKFVTADEC